MKKALGLIAIAIGALASPGTTQVHKVAFEWDADDGGHARLDTCVAASPNRVLVATNQQITLLTRTGVQKDLIEWGEAGSIFQDSFFVDPRVDYDPYSQRLWIVIVGSGGAIHVAVAKDSTPETLTPADWHVYTGSNAFDLTQIGSGTPYQPLGGADHPAISFGPNHMWLTSLDLTIDPKTSEVLTRQGIAVFPKTHDSGSILNGDPMTANDLFGVSPADPPDPLVDPDLTRYHFPIQETFESVEGGQFFVSYPAEDGAAAGHFTAVRLGGAWFDQVDELQYQWKDIMLGGSDDYFSAGTDDIWPTTPKEEWEVRPTPSASSKFDSGVFARDSTEAAPLRIFTGHNVLVSSGGGSPQPVAQTEFRWYVIDPDLDNFPGSGWTPTIEVAGRAPTGSLTDGHTYQGGIGVNDLGAAYITFTRSGESGTGAWPSLVRAKLAMNYTSVLTELNSSSQLGPAYWYDEGSGPDGDLGADYADIQADYVHCGFWTAGALVKAGTGTPPAASDIRETWVTEISVSCNQAEMNGDGAVDAADLAIYLDYYAKGDQRADMDRSGTITIDDYAIYTAEYARR